MIDKLMFMVYNKIDFYWEWNYDLYLEEEGKEEIESGL